MIGANLSFVFFVWAFKIYYETPIHPEGVNEAG